MLAALCAAAGLAGAAPVTVRAQGTLVLDLKDYATLPMTGIPEGTSNDGSLARINFMREEPGGAGRFFINDLNGPLYILDKQTRRVSTYLDFNGRDGRGGMFARMPFVTGFANGFISFQFDPDYRKNGKLYTIHLEDTSVKGQLIPNTRNAPGLRLDRYTPTAAVKTPGEVEREAVLIEWTDSNIANTTFEGTARELLRVELNTRLHPMGDMIFNPAARPGGADWGVIYISCGDGGSGEQKSAMRQNPQRLDTLVGKILRIIPDLTAHTTTSTVSDNGRYRIPRDNPFASVAGARKEIWAYGLRNPHRLSWDVDPVNPSNSHLLAFVIGLQTWEAIDVIHRGANYGYSEREGTERLRADNTTTALPAVDEVPVRVSATQTMGTVTPTYPVVAYPHTAAGGDAITGGFVYRGKLLPALQGKVIYGDITTGKLWYADLKEMLAADDGKAATLAAGHEIQLRWDAPGNAAAAGRVYPTMFPVVLAAYKTRGGLDPNLPGTSTVSGPGRADIRLAVDAAGELYVLSKMDGMVRALAGATAR
ncbi:MAG: PQQ-dependent sugar dehydrogenase [Acidobacteriota bacterium]